MKEEIHEYSDFNPYELPKPLGFNLRKAIAYGKEHGIEVREIPEEILENLCKGE